MTIGQWVGQWFGEWFGSGELAPAGSMSGSATLTLSTVGSVTGKGILEGTASVTLHSSGELTAAASGTMSGVASFGMAATATATCTGTPLILDSSYQPAAGGVFDDAGRGHIWRDNAWVKSRKVARIRKSDEYVGSAVSRVYCTSKPAFVRSKYGQGRASSDSAGRAVSSKCGVKTTHGCVAYDSFCTSNSCKSIVSVYNGACESVGIEEILAALEMA